MRVCMYAACIYIHICVCVHVYNVIIEVGMHACMHACMHGGIAGYIKYACVCVCV